jgi:transcriptional regulator with XRE-family HTH domain
LGTLREERVRRLLSVRSLAERAEVAPTTVHLIETGRRRPQFLTIERLSRALAIDPMEVMEFRMALDAAAHPPVQGKADDR